MSYVNHLSERMEKFCLNFIKDRKDR